MAQANFRGFMIRLGIASVVLLALAYHGLWRLVIDLDDAPHVREFSGCIQLAVLLHLRYVGFRRKPWRELWTRDLGYQLILGLGAVLVVLASQRIKAGYFPLVRVLPWLGLLLFSARGLMIGVRHHFPEKGWKSGLATSLWALASLGMLVEAAFTQVAETHGSVKTLANLTWHARYGQPLNSLGAADIEHDTTALNDRRKKTLLYLGDSFTAGAGLKDFQHTRYSSLVKNAHCPDVQWNHVNLGLGGANQIQEKQMLDRFPYPYDAVVLSYYINDIYPVAQALGKAKEIEVFDYQGYDFISHFLIDHSYFLNWAFWRFPHKVEADYLGELCRLYEDPDVYPQHLKELRDLLDGIDFGRPVIVLLFPMLKDIERQHGIFDGLEPVFVHHGCYVIRVDRFPDLLDEPERYIVNRNDLHPNEALHALVGDSITERIHGQYHLYSRLCFPQPDSSRPE